MLYIDNRWKGNYGIGRFSQEVIKRLEVPFQIFRSEKLPALASDILNLERMKLTSSDVIYSPGYNSGFTRARQLLTLHDLFHLQVVGEATFSRKLYYEHIIRPAIKKTGTVITVSESSANKIREWLNDVNVQVVSVGNACSSVFKVEGEKYQLDNGKDYFLYVGNLKSHKNVEILFRALKKRPTYQLLLVTNERDAVMSLAEKYQTEKQIYVISNVKDEELASIYRGSKGLLMPSLIEGFGYPAVEALSSGKKVAYWMGCDQLSEVVQNKGIAVTSADIAEDWAESMDSLTINSQFDPTTEFIKRYNFDCVASKVNALLRQEITKC